MKHLLCASARLRACAFLCVCASLLSCEDPRGRPVPPIVQASFSPLYKLTSPGQILASVYLYDTDGLVALTMSARSADSVLALDSSVAILGDVELTRVINFAVPAGIPTGTAITVALRAEDLVGFATSDTLHLVVQDSL